MPSVPMARFAAELDTLYRSSRAPLTASKMRQVLRELAEQGVLATKGLTPAAIAGFVAAGRARGRAGSTIRTHLGYLRRACGYAADRGYVRASPFALWPDYLGQAPEEDVPEAGWGEPDRHHPAEAIGRVLRHLEARAGLSWADHRLFVLAALVAFTGLRRNEALFLKWADVRLESSVLRVSRRRRLKRPTAAAPVAIPDRLAAILAAWRPESGPSGYVVPNASGSNPWTGGMSGCKPLDRLKRAGAEVGVAGLTFQSLRHSWATHAEGLWGMGEALIQRGLRHTRSRTTALYRHADVANLVAAARPIDFPAA